MEVSYYVKISISYRKHLYWRIDVIILNINRNYIFLEVFSLTLILAFLLNVVEFVARTITDHPNDYIVIFAVYSIVLIVIVLGFYKLTYRPPKYDKMFNKARKKETSLIDGLKTKIETIDNKQAKKIEKTKKQNQKVSANISTQLSKKPKQSTSKQYSSSKSKNVRRRR